MYRIPSIDFCVHLFPSPSGCGEIRTGRVVSVPSYEFYSGVGSYPFSASKPSTIVCRARNEPTQRRIKPGSSQPTVPLPTNCPLSLVCVCVCACVCVWRWSENLQLSDLTTSFLTVPAFIYSLCVWCHEHLQIVKPDSQCLCWICNIKSSWKQTGRCQEVWHKLSVKSPTREGKL